MTKTTTLAFTICMMILFLANTKNSTPVESKFLPKLSDYQFFVDQLADLKPGKNVIPYELNTPLFSDYALKARFVKFPEGATVDYNAKEVLDFPVGTAIIKTFYYLKDFRKPEGKRTLIETRVLLHEENGWVAIPYIWDDAQTDAFLDVAGDKKEVQWKNEKGKKQKLDYVIPNMNQCKGCHSYNNEIRPIGPSARQLNGDYAYADGSHNQLQKWADLGYLKNMHSINDAPKVPIWNDATSGDLNTRARAYLDINCAHCHRKEGPANTSGLFLDYHQENLAALGVNKSPIAAGRGSGDRQFGIVPGDANASIMYYRMGSVDPGIMMPELSRKLIHKEGLALIKEWINEMK